MNGSTRTDDNTLSFFKEIVEPKRWKPDSVYFIISKDKKSAKAYVTTNYGVPKPISGVGDLTLNEVTSYRSSFTSPYVYSGFLLNGSPVITRYKDGLHQTAINVINLEVDWNNRLILTYL